VTDEPIEADAPVHEAFGLTYASYLVLPRSVLQHMPLEWQRRFLAMLDELPAAAREGAYWVRRKDERGRFAPDPLAQYRHPDREMLERLFAAPAPKPAP
jgi:hypothetical protein